MLDEVELKSIRRDFPVFKHRRQRLPPVYLDNACTTLVPHPVVKAMDAYYNSYPGCGGARSRHWFAGEVTDRIEGNPEKDWVGSRALIKNFIHAPSARDIIFTQNTSHAINLVALGFKFRPGDVVLLSATEHNSNLLPWLRLQDLGQIQVEQVASDAEGRFDLDDFRRRLAGGRVRLVSLAYTSNLTGYTVPASDIIPLAHAAGARVLLDAAQTAAHQPIDVQALDVDLLAFSLHKMCGPRGVGVLFGKPELLGRAFHEKDDAPDALAPCFLGGGTVGDATYQSYSLLEPPERFEVGIQNYPGQIAAGTAIDYLNTVGLDRIGRHLADLNAYLTEQLLARYAATGWFRIFGPRDGHRRAGILTFEVRRPNAVGIAEELSDRFNVMIRDGVFCVHSYLNRQFGEGWLRPRLPAEHRMTYRLSVYFYNTLAECQFFLEALDTIFRERNYL